MYEFVDLVLVHLINKLHGVLISIRLKQITLLYRFFTVGIIYNTLCKKIQ